MIKLVMSTGKNGELGYKNQLCWDIKKDKSHFKYLTENEIVVMGYDTFLSIGKPLPNRLNVILTNKRKKELKENLSKLFIKEMDISTLSSCYTKFLEMKRYSTNGFTSVKNLEIDDVIKNKRLPINIIGGAKVYKQFEKYADVVYMTRIADSSYYDALWEFNYDYNWTVKYESEVYKENCRINNKEVEFKFIDFEKSEGYN